MKKITYWLFALFLSWQMSAQTGTVVVGINNGVPNTTTSNPSPLQDYYKTQRLQMLYTAAELTSAGLVAGNITNVGWVTTNLNTSTLEEGYTISMKSTTSTVLTTTFETGTTVVYGPTDFTPTASGNVVFTLATPFVWDGTSNIIIQVCAGSASGEYTTNVSCSNEVTSNNKTIYVISDTATAPCSTTTGTATTTRPLVVLTGNVAGCLKPLNIIAGAITATTASISWDAVTPTPSLGYEYVVSTSNVAPTGAGTATTSTFASLSSLLPQTQYYIFLRSKCDATTYSSWNGPVGFKTACANVTSFTQNFDGVTTANLPSCWAKVGPNGYAYLQTFQSSSAPNNLYMVSYGSTPADLAVMSMQQVSNLGAGTNRIKFDMACGTVGGIIEFGYLTDPLDASTFVALTSFTAATTTYSSYQFSPPAGTYSNFPAFRHTGVSTNSVYIDNVVWETTPSCPDITGIATAAITSSGVSGSWDAIATATGYQYAVTTSATPPAFGTATTNTYAIVTGLTPQTTYYLHVRATCSGSTFGVWSTTSFMTACVPLTTLPWSENFDALTPGTNVFPPCWAYVNTTSTWSISTAPVAFSGANSLRRTYGTDGWAFTPLISLTAGTSYRFSYYVRTNDTTVGYDNTVAVGNGQSVAAMTTTLLSQTGYQNPNWVKQNIEFTPTTTGDYSFGLHVVAPFAPNGENFDNFRVELSPTCPDQTGVVVAAITSSGVSASWDAITGAAGYEYAITTSATPPTAGTATTNTFVVVNTLTPQTLYYVHVRAMCGVGSYGNWGTTSFTTACVPVATLPWTENFDALTPGTNVFPTCWGFVNTTNTWSIATFPVAYSGANSLRRTWSTDGWAFTPLFNLTAGTSYRFSYYVRTNDATVGYDNTVAVGNGQSVAAMTTTLLTQTAYQNPTWVKQNIQFTPTTTGAYSFGLHVVAPVAPNGENFDNFTLELSPTCPDQTGVVIGTATTTGATFSWDPITGAAGYEYAVTTSATPPASGTATAATFATVSSLTPQTQYYAHVRAMCGVGSYGNWGTTSFITGYCIPSSTSNSTYVNDFSTTGGSANISNLGTGYTTGGYNNASAQFVQGFATSSFTFNAAIVGGTAGFSIWVDWNNDLVFDNATEKVFNTTSYGNGPFTGTITIPAGTTIGNHRMRITTDYLASNPSLPCGNPTTAEFEDYTISVIAPPACGAPAPVASIVGSTTATLSWPAVASAAVGYEYVLDNVVTNPATAGTPTTAITYAATSLTPSTTYYFHIRSVCSVGTFSTWSTVSFTTACVAQNVPYSQNFESATTPNLPSCTSIQNVGAGNLWTVQNAPGNGFTTNTLTYSYNSTNAANVWFYTNGVNLTAGTAYKISYDYGTSFGSFYTEKLKVAYGTSASAASMTNVLADYTAVVNEAPISDVVNFTPTTSGVYYFGFNAKSDANEDQLYVDNILVDVALGNNSFNSTSFSVYPNPVKNILNINYIENITKIQVVNMLGQEVLTKSVNNTQNQIDMSQLVQGTYLVKITSNDLVKTMKVIKE